MPDTADRHRVKGSWCFFKSEIGSLAAITSLDIVVNVTDNSIPVVPV